MGEKNQMYYYVCYYPLGQGSIVEKGNWGRITRIQSLLKPLSTYVKLENIFEKIRLKEFPNRPSRLDCSFLCPNISSLKKFMNKHNNLSLPYEVELTNQNAKKFETDWSLIKKDKPVKEIEKNARKYWNPQNVKDENKEILTESDIRIVRRICTAHI